MADGSSGSCSPHGPSRGVRPWEGSCWHGGGGPREVRPGLGGGGTPAKTGLCPQCRERSGKSFRGWGAVTATSGQITEASGAGVCGAHATPGSEALGFPPHSRLSRDPTPSPAWERAAAPCHPPLCPRGRSSQPRRRAGAEDVPSPRPRAAPGPGGQLASFLCRPAGRARWSSCSPRARKQRRGEWTGWPL